MRAINDPEDNLLARHLDTAQIAGCDPVVRITNDRPFAPPAETDRIVAEHGENDARYTTNVRKNPIGTAVDAIDTAVLEELYRMGESHPVRRLREQPAAWDVSFSTSDECAEFTDAYTAVDTSTDCCTLIDAVETVGEDPLAVTRWVETRQDK